MLERVQKVFSQVFGVDEGRINLDSTIENTVEWDSLRHLELVMSLEKEFSVKFKMGEITALNSVAKIVDLLDKKANKAA